MSKSFIDILGTSVDATERETDYIRYSLEYMDGAMNVIRKSYLQFEPICRACKIADNEQACMEVEKLCLYIMGNGASILARDKETGAIVGVILNMLEVSDQRVSSDHKWGEFKPNLNSQARREYPNEMTFLEFFRERVCKTENSRTLMQTLNDINASIDLYTKYSIECKMEIMFLAVLPEFTQRGIGTNLFKYSLQLAEDIRKGTASQLDVPAGGKILKPKLISTICTSLYPQKIAKKLGFKDLLEVPFTNTSFHTPSPLFNYEDEPEEEESSPIVSILYAKLLEWYLSASFQPFWEMFYIISVRKLWIKKQYWTNLPFLPFTLIKIHYSVLLRNLTSINII